MMLRVRDDGRPRARAARDRSLAVTVSDCKGPQCFLSRACQQAVCLLFPQPSKEYGSPISSKGLQDTLHVIEAQACFDARSTPYVPASANPMLATGATHT